MFDFLVNGGKFLLKGGFVMWPLFACAVVSLAVMLERFLVLRKAAADSRGLMDRVQQRLAAGHPGEALSLCEGTPGPVPAMLAAGLRHRHLDLPAIEREMEEQALKETPLLSKRLGVLDTIITLAPLLGLLGTITGMISAFHVVALTSSVSDAPTAITGGVAEALIATATGLTIAIITLPGYNYLSERVKEIIADMEVRGTQLINTLANPGV